LPVVVVVALSVDVNLIGLSRPDCLAASSLHDEVVSDGVSDTKLCVSSKPSSFSSCDSSLVVGVLSTVDEGMRKMSFAFHSRSGVGDFKLLIASRTSS